MGFNSAFKGLKVKAAGYSAAGYSADVFGLYFGGSIIECQPGHRVFMADTHFLTLHSPHKCTDIVLSMRQLLLPFTSFVFCS